MRDHAQIADDLALYAMGALEAKSCPEMEAHLSSCAECRQELQALRGDMALLALTAAGPRPPQRSRQRLMEAVGEGSKQPPQQPQKTRSGWPWPRWLFWAPLTACVLLAAFSVHVMIVHQRSHEEFVRIQRELENERTRSSRAQEIIDMMNDPKAEHMTLVSAKSAPQPQVKTIYAREQGHVLVMANNLPQPPAKMAYELWLLPAADGKPMPCGTFKTDWRGTGMSLLGSGYSGVDAKGFAVTVEPESGSPWPTSPVLLASSR